MKITTGRDPPTDHSRAQIAPRLHTDAPIREIIELIFKNHLNNNIMKTTVVNSNLNGKTNRDVTAKAGSTTQTPPNPKKRVLRQAKPLTATTKRKTSRRKTKALQLLPNNRKQSNPKRKRRRQKQPKPKLNRP